MIDIINFESLLRAPRFLNRNLHPPDEIRNYLTSKEMTQLITSL